MMVLVVKNLPANARDTRDMGSNSGSGDALEDGMATRSSILAWRIPWAEKPGGSHSVHRIAKSWTRLKRNILIHSLESKYLEHLLHFMDEKIEILYGKELQGYEGSFPF